MKSLWFKYSSKALGFYVRIIEWTLGPHNCSYIFLQCTPWDLMISLVFKHPSKILGFRTRAIEGTLGSHKPSMHLSLFTFSLDGKSSFKYPSETLGFCVRMIQWTLELYQSYILSFPPPFIIWWWTSFLQKTSNVDEGINEKGSKNVTLPISCSLRLYILSYAMFHAFILVYYVPYSSIVCYFLWYILRAWLRV